MSLPTASSADSKTVRKGARHGMRASHGEAPPVFDLKTFFPYLVRVYYRAVSSAVSNVYTSRHGLTVSQWRTMAVLGPNRALSASEIVEQSSMDKVNVSRAVTGLRKAGLLKRDIDGDDRRRAALRLTEAGLDIYEDLTPRMYEIEASLLEGLTEDERATLIELMGKVRRNAELIEQMTVPRG